ncbi:Rne/Rng family ribonuclease [Aquipuribacter sp. SD81]|uniref:Rne/Rng family ribonuclease n=1 Tax=Aquipuribacter sp. SD81 TaxID=3127703 RepID=UPI00301876CF
MLEDTDQTNEQPTGQPDGPQRASADAPVTTTRPRRRRAASRPAGPPEPEATPAPEPAPEPAPGGGPSPEDAPVVGDGTDDEDVPTEDVPTDEGPTDEGPAVDDGAADGAAEEQPTAGTAETADTEPTAGPGSPSTASQAVFATPFEEPAAPAARRPRRRATSAAGPPAADIFTAAPPVDFDDLLPPPVAGDGAAEDTGSEAAERPARRRGGRRATRPAAQGPDVEQVLGAVASPGASGTADSAPDDAVPAETSDEGAADEDTTGASEATDDDDEGGQRRSRRGGRGRRRRGGRGRAEADDSSDADETGDAEDGDEDEREGTDRDADADADGSGGDGTAGDGSDGTDAGDTGDDGDDGDEDDEAEGSGGRSGRRGRRGRGRSGRRGGRGSGDATDDADPGRGDAAGAVTGDDSDEPDDSDDSDEDPDGGSRSSRRRRRRRRRAGSGDADLSPDPDDPPGTVVRIRESRADEVTKVKGSTRLEAKRQRRREGRGERRKRTVITEAEFLTRRESVDRTLLVRQLDDRAETAVLEDGVLVEHHVSRPSQQSMIGNVFLGKVQNVLPSMEAAFVDIGRGRNAVLYAGEVNWDAVGLPNGAARTIEAALKPGDPVLAQVSKDPIGHKGARLTAQVSLPGRYLVYVPGSSMTGISRKLPETERARLKKVLRRVVPEDAGVIVRTAAEGASETELERDVARLKAQWEDIERKAGAVNAPARLYSEPDLAIKVVRDVFNEDFTRLFVQGDDAWDTLDGYVRHVAPDLAERMTRWQPVEHDGKDLFAEHRIDEQLAKALDRKVWLPSGGSLVIDRTEAMTVVDVNTGKYTGSGGNLEETVTRNNLEAAEEIVRQLRLRDIGGIIVVDFIDMVLESNRNLVLRRLVECLGRDRTKHQVAEVTSLGLVQLTRKRVGSGLLESFSTPCEHCAGRGVVVHDEPVGAAAGGHSGGHSGSGSSGGSGGGGSRRRGSRSGG